MKHLYLASILASGIFFGIASFSPATAQETEPCGKERATAEERARSDDLDLAICLLGSDSEEDKNQSASMLKRLADAGDVEALQGYAVAVSQGIGLPADEEQGQKLMEQAAEAGSGGALLTLAQHYWDDDGFYPEDKAKALAMKIKAAEIGGFTGASLGEVQWQIGMHFLDGEGADADKKAAYSWVSKGAESGSTNGMISRAVMLATGEGVKEDDAKARGWYKKAIASKDHDLGHALRGLGYMMVIGEGGEEDVRNGCTNIAAGLVLQDKLAAKLMGQLTENWAPERIDDCFNRATEYLAATVPERFEE